MSKKYCTVMVFFVKQKVAVVSCLGLLAAATCLLQLGLYLRYLRLIGIQKVEYKNHQRKAPNKEIQSNVIQSITTKHDDASLYKRNKGTQKRMETRSEVSKSNNTTNHNDHALSDQKKGTLRMSNRSSIFKSTRTNNASLDDKKGLIANRDNENTENPIISFYKDYHRIIRSLVNEESILHWGFRNYYGPEFYNLFDVDEINTDVYLLEEQQQQQQQQQQQSSLVYKNKNMERIWTGKTGKGIIFAMGKGNAICPLSKQFKAFGSIKKHVAIVNLNENMGAFSSPVVNRTIDWGAVEYHWKSDPDGMYANVGSIRAGCTNNDIMEYLDHENTRAIITTQHQAFDHPKVHSIPLGVHSKFAATYIVKRLLEEEKFYEGQQQQQQRPQLLMINSRPTKDRVSQIQAVVKNFLHAKVRVKNTFRHDFTNLDDYFNEVKRSKFILCPSGLGWDTYRMWEAFYFGTIPVVERYNRKDGWHRTMDDLPIVWVDTFEKDVTPDFLEKQYKRIIEHGVSSYKLEKLTKQYWISFVESFVPRE